MNDVQNRRILALLNMLYYALGGNGANLLI